MLTKLQVLATVAGLGLSIATAPGLAASAKKIEFDMVVSVGATTCLPDASASVTVTPSAGVEIMDVDVDGLPPNTVFNLFVLQVPKAPFGVSWYQGDIETGKNGHGHQRVVGIFSVETFAVAAGSAPAPVVFNGPFPDASLNPPFNPVQMYHLGIWFDSPSDALSAGCPGTVTPFSGEHSAGIQVLNTSNFPDDQGPLRSIVP
ncbi:MAG TPA: hypothetical protein VFF44_00675 [Casimicrobiaceae bacterium]|nr:hypothetical protein [Casimicrobiaceae bacterium]